VLDVDDTFDAVHGEQQMRLFNAHYDEYGFQPIVVFDGEGTVARSGVATVSDTLTLSAAPQSRFGPVGSEVSAGRYPAQNSLAHQRP